MIGSEYFFNAPSKNILNESEKKNITDSFYNCYSDNIIDNMILNSNLINDNEIK